MNNVLNEASTSHRSWNNLSMQEKAAMIRVAVKNGLTDLKTIREKYNEFAGGGRKDDGWTLEDENKYQLWRASLPDNLKNTNDNTYDMRAAFKAGMQPVLLSDGYYHLGSRDPETGRILKAPYHPTYLQAINTDARMGYYPSIDNKGNTYTDTWVGNQFARGGSKKKKSTSTISPYAQRAMDYFMKKGLSKHAAAGLVGNLMRESNFNVTATNPYSGAYGLAQWLGSRKDRLFAKYGKNPTFDQQLDFAWWELNNTHKKGLQRLLNAPTAADAAADAMGYYEFSAGRQGAINDMAKHKQDGIGAMKKGIANANLLMGLPADSYSIELPSVATQPVETSGYQPVPAFMPNPEIFATVPAPTTYTTEYPEIPTAPVLEYDPKEAERQEKRDNLSRFNMFLGMLNGSNESTFPFSMFAEGGGIHIKPENRGKFTALKERTGHSATWFKEHGTPAQKKMATFALNSRHWKHSLGGNLFEDGGPKKPLTRDDLRRMLLNRRAEAEAAYNGSVTETQITPNDNAWVDKPLTRRKKNPHSSRRAEEGAKAHAAWEREHPNLATWGNLAGTIPFAVAAAPLGAGIVAGGDALAATTAGQAITSGLAPLYQAATGATIAGVPALAWADAGLTSAFGAHGISQAVEEGGISPMTALEIAPLGRLAKPIANETINAGKLAYNERYIPWKISSTMNRSLDSNPIIRTYASNPKYKDIGTLLDYQDYIQSIFPNSTIRNVVYHTTYSKPFEQFDPNKIKRGFGFYFSPSEHSLPFGRNVYAKVNIKNPLEINKNTNPTLSVDGLSGFGTGASKRVLATRNALNSGKYDGIIGITNMRNPGEPEIVALDPNQIHILGSSRDLIGFKRASSALSPKVTAENNAYRAAYPNIRYDIPNSDIIIESSTSANPNIPFDEAWLAASKGRHQMSNLVGSDDYAGRIRQAYQDNGIPINQADFEILQAKQGIEDSNLKVVPNLKNTNGEVINGQYDPNTGQILVSQDRENILDVVESSGHEHAHASEVEKLLELLKEKWKHIKPRKEAFTRSDGSIDTEWKDYISKIVEMRAPAMSVWSEMKELGFNKVGDYLHHLKRFGLEDKQWEALVNRYGLTNAKYMVETVFGLSPFVINGISNEKEDNTTM